MFSHSACQLLEAIKEHDSLIILMCSGIIMTLHENDKYKSGVRRRLRLQQQHRSNFMMLTLLRFPTVKTQKQATHQRKVEKGHLFLQNGLSFGRRKKLKLRKRF